MKRIDISMAIGLACSILLSSFGVFGNDCTSIRDSSLRLHILANSDSEEDQRLKLAVRDAVLDATFDVFTSASDKEEAAINAEDNLALIGETARAVVHQSGYAYDVSVKMVQRYFNTRDYGGFTMPAGIYDAVQVEIGSGRGQNWWCVMFPPMCLPAASEAEADSLEDQILHLGEQPHYKPAFALVEVLEALCDDSDAPNKALT